MWYNIYKYWIQCVIIDMATYTVVKNVIIIHNFTLIYSTVCAYYKRILKKKKKAKLQSTVTNKVHIFFYQTTVSSYITAIFDAFSQSHIHRGQKRENISQENCIDICVY